MIVQEPTAAVQVEIPYPCTMHGELTVDMDMQFRFGEPDSGITIVFERLALEQFLHLAIDLLATPLPEDTANMPRPIVRPAV